MISFLLATNCFNYNQFVLCSKKPRHNSITWLIALICSFLFYVVKDELQPTEYQLRKLQCKWHMRLVDKIIDPRFVDEHWFVLTNQVFKISLILFMKFLSFVELHKKSRWKKCVVLQFFHRDRNWIFIQIKLGKVTSFYSTFIHRHWSWIWWIAHWWWNHHQRSFWSSVFPSTHCIPLQPIPFVIESLQK